MLQMKLAIWEWVSVDTGFQIRWRRQLRLGCRGEFGHCRNSRDGLLAQFVHANRGEYMAGGSGVEGHTHSAP